ncbi:hypothetical protein [Agromyces aureus]|uniref:Uncharacterized protein n=1 Tax=Agromyces aureus TaxID=453304 RepID=A0A191WBR8_9MICO|nr:hypothetical protein [Agromyces aureus]ANJ25629.1 hypothetical protein ATC03_01480 [Agromyces aureus]
MTVTPLATPGIVDFELRIHRRWIVAAALALTACGLYLSMMPMATSAQVAIIAAHDERIRFGGLQLPHVEPDDEIGLTTSVGSFRGRVLSTSPIPDSNAIEVTIRLEDRPSTLPELGSSAIAKFPEQPFIQVLVQRR